MNGQDKNFITIKEAQKVLKASRNFIYGQVRSGNITLYKVGRKSYLKTSEIDSLFQPVAKVEV